MKTNLLAMAGAAIVALGASPARAQDAHGCFPPVVGVPWSGAAPTAASLDDLVWNGSFGYQWSNGTLADGAFRTLLGTDAAGNKTIYIYYKNLVHRSQINYGDGLQIGISYDEIDATSHLKTKTVGQIVSFQFGADEFSGPHGDGTWRAADATDPNNPKYIDPTFTGIAQLMQQTTTYDSAGHATTVKTVSAPGADPTWVKSNSYFWILPDASDPGKIYYVAQLALPVKTVKPWTTAGLYIDPADLASSTGVPFFGDELSFEISPTALVPRPWPNKDYNSQGRFNADPSQPPSPDHWGRLEAAPYPTCKGGGLGFTPSDILNNGGYTIDLYAKDTSSALGWSPGKNNFAVNVSNGNATLDPKSITATFNIAPYGSQTTHSTAWKPLSDSGNAVTCASGTAGDTNKCKPKFAGGNPILAKNSGSSLGASSFTLSGSAPWTPDWSYTCAVNGDDGVLYSARPDIGGICTTGGKGTWLPSAADAAVANAIFEHQCMMVTLNATSADVQFDTQAQFMNMHVAAHASHFSQKARIDSSGLPAIKNATGHWMYMVVDTRNMPTDIPNGIVSPYTDKKLQQLLYGEDCGGEFCQYETAHNRGQGTLDYVSQHFPTTVVHVYHDTGMYKTVKRKKIEVYEAQSSYGYYVSHDGKLYGWDVNLSGGGAKRVSDNVWRVWVPNGKAVDVTTSIDALEQPRCGK